nr:hypothetical protein HmN_000506700 [Hymenolepis microstoma]CUU97502.1 Transcriptional regulator, Sir2 family protein [Hymenolepis microstoma]
MYGRAMASVRTAKTGMEELKEVQFAKCRRPKCGFRNFRSRQTVAFTFDVLGSELRISPRIELDTSARSGGSSECSRVSV